MWGPGVVRDMLDALLALQLELLTSPFGRILAAIVAIGIVILVGRIVLRIAWRLVTIAAIIVGLLFLVSTFLP